MRRRWEQSTSGSFAARRLAAGYALLATLASGVAVIAYGELPFRYPTPWFRVDEVSAVSISALSGMVLAMGVIVSTRVAVGRFEWARRLHAELRPVARELTLPHILLVAGLSSLGEELLFRGLFTTWLGVIPSAVLFGLAHQMRGPSRWVWIGWATGVGLALGSIFAATGSLVGPLVAHAVINAVNLTYLRTHEA